MSKNASGLGRNGARKMPKRALANIGAAVTMGAMALGAVACAGGDLPSVNSDESLAIPCQAGAVCDSNSGRCVAP